MPMTSAGRSRRARRRRRHPGDGADAVGEPFSDELNTAPVPSPSPTAMGRQAMVGQHGGRWWGEHGDSDEGDALAGFRCDASPSFCRACGCARLSRRASARQVERVCSMSRAGIRWAVRCGNVRAGAHASAPNAERGSGRGAKGPAVFSEAPALFYARTALHSPPALDARHASAGARSAAGRCRICGSAVCAPGRRGRLGDVGGSRGGLVTIRWTAARGKEARRGEHSGA